MKLLRILICAALTAGVAVPQAIADVSYDFEADDGGFTVDNVGDIEDPWIYNSNIGTWSVDGSTNVGAPGSFGFHTNTYRSDASVPLILTSTIATASNGTERLVGMGSVKYRVNDNGFRFVDGSQFVTEGYVAVIAGNNAMNGLEGFSDVSTGYSDEEYITSVVQLGNFNAGDEAQIEFLGAWDGFARGNPDGTVPNWEVDAVTVVGQVTAFPTFLSRCLWPGKEPSAKTFTIVPETTRYFARRRRCPVSPVEL